MAAHLSAGVSQPDCLVDSWGTDEGLPSDTVSALAQTPDGYLWCGTYDGVARFDGVRFVRVGPDDSAGREASRILCLHVDRRGQLWIGTDGAGLLRYVDGTFTRLAEPAGSPANSVRCIAEDAAGDLWLGTRGGLGRLRNGRVFWFNTAAGFTNAALSIWNLAFGRTGDLWIAEWNRLKVFRDGAFQTVVLNPEVKVPVRAVSADRAGNVLVGMFGHALRRDDDGRWSNLDGAGQLPSEEVTAFYGTRSGDLWIGTRKGLFLRRSGKWVGFDVRDGLPSGEVRAIFEDREGNLWVGTGTGGLARLKRRLLTTYAARDGLTDGPVHALREMADGSLWVGLNNGRLARGTAESFQVLNEFNGIIRDAPVKTILRTHDGALWVGTFGNGLVRLRGDDVTRFVPSVGSPARIDKVTALLEDRAGAVWIGTYYGLYRATDTNVVVPVPVGGSDLRAPVTALLADGSGGLWLAARGLGVAHFINGLTTWLTRRDGLPTDLVRALYADAEGTLWIGTSAGLCCQRRGRITTFTISQGLLDNSISQILEDDADNLWLGSNHGIMRVAKKELFAVADGRKTSLKVFACGRGEGMLNEECSGGFCPAGLKTRDGRLWFPTAQGLVMADPSQLKLKMNRRPPPVHVEEVRANGRIAARPRPAGNAPDKPSAPRAPVILPADTQRLEFVYTALSLTAPERVRFKYRLQGVDTDWTDGGAARSAVYANLPAGRYGFQVIACNNDGVWNEDGQTVAFRIAAPYWQTWWFLLLAAVGSAGFLGAAIRLVSVRQLQRKLRRLEEAHAVEKERMRIAQDMHDEIGGKLSRISFLSDLARRSLPDASATGRQIDEVSEAARDVIRTVDEIVWAVSPRNDTLESLAHYICRHAEEFFELTSLELELQLPAEFPERRLSADIRHNLFCAVKEALNNVLKHAAAAKVQVAFTIHPDAFQITIADNGRGFESNDSPALCPLGDGDGRMITARRGNGLLNMRERLESFGGQCRIESRPGCGTRVAFSVPLK